MTGFNLPPGCNVSDLPGNTKAEQEAEALADSVYAQLKDLGVMGLDYGLKEELQDLIVERVCKLLGDAYGAGYQAAVADEAEYRAIRAEDELIQSNGG